MNGSVAGGEVEGGDAERFGEKGIEMKAEGGARDAEGVERGEGRWEVDGQVEGEERSEGGRVGRLRVCEAETSARVRRAGRNRADSPLVRARRCDPCLPRYTPIPLRVAHCYS